MNKSFCFTVDDNIRFLKELTEGNYPSVFDHPYLAMYRRLHETYGVCVQLNLFYECDGFTLSSMTDAYREEFSENAHWLKMSLVNIFSMSCASVFIRASRRSSASVSKNAAVLGLSSARSAS